MKFARESIADVWGEVQALLNEHWREIAHYQDIPLQPDEVFYLGNPALRCFTAREDCLVGYACFVVAPNKHYMGSLQAMQDVLFISPGHRKGLTGYRFIRWCDEQLKAEGVQVVYHHTKTAHDFGALLTRQGYEEVDRIYAKRLDKG